MRPTKDEFGRPLGYRTRRAWVWFAKPQRYYPRQRVVNGERGTLTPYTTGPFLKPDPEGGPRGGKAYKQCYRQIWHCNGKFCRLMSVRHDENDSWHYEFVPLDGTVYNRYDRDETDEYFVACGEYQYTK